MEIKQLEDLGQIKKGDLLLISDATKIIHSKVDHVKVSDSDGEEIIYDLKRNKYFNVGMYLNGKSWVKDVRIVRLH